MGFAQIEEPLGCRSRKGVSLRRERSEILVHDMVLVDVFRVCCGVGDSSAYLDRFLDPEMVPPRLVDVGEEGFADSRSFEADLEVVGEELVEVGGVGRGFLIGFEEIFGEMDMVCGMRRRRRRGGGGSGGGFVLVETR